MKRSLTLKNLLVIPTATMVVLPVTGCAIIKGNTITSIKVTKNPKLEYAETEKFSTEGMEVTATYSDGSTENVTNDCVTDIEEGTPLTKENTKVTVTHKPSSKTCTFDIAIGDFVHVQNIEIEHYETEEETEYYEKGLQYNYATIGEEPKKLDIKITPESATNKNIKWESNNKDIVDFDAEGKVVPKKEGITSIKAISEDGSKTHEIYFAVFDYQEAKDINFVGEIPSSKQTGDVFEIDAKIEPDSSIQYVQWESSKNDVATIESIPEEYTKARVKCVGVGKTTITAKTYNKTISNSFNLEVTSPKQDIFITDLKLSEDKVDINIDESGTGQLTAAVEPSDASFTDVTWIVDNPNIASFEIDSLNPNKITILPKKIGETKITAITKGSTDKGKHIEKEASISVTGNTIPVTNITIQDKDKDGIIKLEKKKFKQLSCKFEPDKATNKNIKWTSSDNNVVTVVEDKGIINANNVGEATITATALGSDPKKQVIDTCTVKVEPFQTYKITLETDGNGIVNYTPKDVIVGTPFKKALDENKVEIISKDFYPFSHWVDEKGDPITDDYEIRSDLTAKAIFKESPMLEAENPDLHNYVKGEYFDPIGLQVKAKYKDSTIKTLDRSEWTTSIPTNSKLETVGDNQEVVVSLVSDPLVKTSYKIKVVETADVVAENIEQDFGDIKVRYKLMSNQECVLTGYVSGKGNLLIPDYILCNGDKYYIKRIPKNWSSGNDNIHGLCFYGKPHGDDSVKETNTQHLKIIEESAFEGTNALDNYTGDCTEILKFPEGLVEIRSNAFYGTDYSFDSLTLSGYDFPSSLRLLGSKALGGTKTPYIKPINEKRKSKLIFRCPKANVDYGTDAIGSEGVNHVNYVYGPTQEAANEWSDFLSKTGCFCLTDISGTKYLTPNSLKHNITISSGEHGTVEQKSIVVDDGSTWESVKNMITCRPDQDYHLKGFQKNDGTFLADSFAINSDITIKAIFSQNSDITKIDITTQADLKTYSKGEYFDPIGMVVTATKKDNTTRVLNNSEWSTNLEYNLELQTVGKHTVTVKLNEDPTICTTYEIDVIDKATEVSESNNTAIFGDICVQFKLMSNQECVLTKYVSGRGNLLIPDYVVRQNKKWYIKRIPKDWSNGENDITGFDFHGKASGGGETITRVQHLKVIEEEAFIGTNVLDHWIQHNEVILKFPEGLVEIGQCAFKNTEIGQGKIVGYDLPSTIRYIGRYAFSFGAPWIDGDKNNESRLVFRCPKELVQIDDCAFENYGGPFGVRHATKAIYAPTYQMAYDWAVYLSGLQAFKTDGFNTWLIPKVLKV